MYCTLRLQHKLISISALLCFFTTSFSLLLSLHYFTLYISFVAVVHLSPSYTLNSLLHLFPSIPSLLLASHFQPFIFLPFIPLSFASATPSLHSTFFSHLKSLIFPFFPPLCPPLEFPLLHSFFLYILPSSPFILCKSHNDDWHTCCWINLALMLMLYSCMSPI